MPDVTPTREARKDEMALLDLEAAIGEFEHGGWHNVKRRRPIIAAARGYLRLLTEMDALIGEVGLRLLRYERSGGTLTIERVTTEMLNVFDGLLIEGDQ